LHPEIPTLSKTTVYNTLNLLLEAGLVKHLNFEENETRYDIITEITDTLSVNICGFISNFGLNIESIETGELTGYKITTKAYILKAFAQNAL
jgi:Fur family transcriptional regulator, peroxide stress response regulator